jgi:hypothetical protein
MDERGLRLIAIGFLAFWTVWGTGVYLLTLDPFAILIPVVGLIYFWMFWSQANDRRRTRIAMGREEW